MHAVHRITALMILISILNATGSADKKAAKKTARRPVKMPGLVIDLQKRCLDIEAVVCLDKGLLELIACRKGSKEHESIVAVRARAMHIHTGLLLLGAVNGHPAMRKQVGNDKRWVQVPASGDPIEVFLVFANKAGRTTERPISDFIVHSRQRVDEVDGEVLNAPKRPSSENNKKLQRLPNAFVFAGSQLKDIGPGPRQYLADVSGNVISIATFGDELLCLPFHQTQKNDALLWQVKPKSLPKVGTKVTLRLRLKRKSKKTPDVKRIDESKTPRQSTNIARD